jgi:hypothetical protein
LSPKIIGKLEGLKSLRILDNGDGNYQLIDDIQMETLLNRIPHGQKKRFLHGNGIRTSYRKGSMRNSWILIDIN